MLGWVILVVIGVHGLHPVRYVSTERFARGEYAKCIVQGRLAVAAIAAKQRHFRPIKLDIALDCTEQVTLES
jgi:hypothetical protein